MINLGTKINWETSQWSRTHHYWLGNFDFYLETYQLIWKLHYSNHYYLSRNIVMFLSQEWYFQADSYVDFQNYYRCLKVHTCFQVKHHVSNWILLPSYVSKLTTTHDFDFFRRLFRNHQSSCNCRWNKSNGRSKWSTSSSWRCHWCRRFPLWTRFQVS